MNYARTRDTLLHLRSSYIQCSPRKRTSTAKLLALRNIQSLHIETVWDEKKKTLNIFSLGLHTVHIELPYCYLLGLQVVHICRGSIAWYPLLLPLDHTWSPNSFSQKIWIYVQMQDTFSEMKPLRWSGLVTHSQTRSFFWGFTLDVEEANPKLVRAVPGADVDIEGSVKPSCNFRWMRGE